MWEGGRGEEVEVAFSNIHLTLVENDHFAIGPCDQFLVASNVCN